MVVLRLLDISQAGYRMHSRRRPAGAELPFHQDIPPYDRPNCTTPPSMLPYRMPIWTTAEAWAHG
jgi:hypothetical protein